MLENLIALDKELLIYLNNLGSETFDPFWLIITKQLNWLPFFLMLFYFMKKKLSWKKVGIIVLFLAFLILLTDQLTNLVKYSVERLRPCNTEDIMSMIRIVKSSSSFSFFSGHASNSSATMLFLFLILRRYYRHAYLVFIFPLIFAYSRIYLSLHFPGDILVGFVVGIINGTIFYKLFQWMERKYNI